jgi:FtsZ-binding cell division protein ZapB
MSVETHVHQYVKIVETLKQEVTALKEKLADGEHRELQQAKKYEETIARLQAQLQVRSTHEFWIPPIFALLLSKVLQSSLYFIFVNN